MPLMKLWNGVTWITLDAANAMTVGGKKATDFAPVTHIGTGGASHALSTGTVAGFMSPTDKAKLDFIEPEEKGKKVTVATLNAALRVKDSERIEGKTLVDLDSRFANLIPPIEKTSQKESFYKVVGIAETKIPINIASYSSDGDLLDVYQDGLRLRKDSNYKLDGTGKYILLQGYSGQENDEFQFIVTQRTNA